MKKQKNPSKTLSESLTSVITTILLVGGAILAMKGNDMGKFRYNGRYYWIVWGGSIFFR